MNNNIKDTGLVAEVEFKGVCKLRISTNMRVFHYDMLSAAFGGLCQWAACNPVKVSTATKQQTVYDCNGPSWSHTSWVEENTTRVEVEILDLSVYSENKQRLFEWGWWSESTECAHIKYERCWYGGKAKVELEYLFDLEEDLEEE